VDRAAFAGWATAPVQLLSALFRMPRKSLFLNAFLRLPDTPRLSGKLLIPLIFVRTMN
jgi:hypothetical protein